jgi:Ca2+-binding RTX toxin-like protein
LVDLVQRLDGSLASYGDRADDYAFVVMALSSAAPFAAERAHWDMIRAAQLGLSGGHFAVVDPDRIAVAHGLAPAQLFGTDGLHYRDSVNPMLLDALINPAPQFRTGTATADRMIGMAGADRLLGLGGADVIVGGAGRDYVDGGAGDDLILTLGDGDRLFGGAGIDTLAFFGPVGVTVNVYRGVSNADLRFWQFENIHGSGGADNLAGDAVANMLDGALGNDVLSGFGGNDRLFGADGDDILYGNEGADRLYGGAGDDALRGAAQNDVLFGDAGRDLLRGGTGIDTLMGGAGDDQFDFISLAEAQTGADFICDFSNMSGNNDTIRVSTAFAAGLTAGSLLPGQFLMRMDNLAQDTDDRFIFRVTDRTLWFDSNGAAADGLTLLADFQAGAVVTAADILIF